MTDLSRVLAESDVVHIETVAIDPRPAITYIRSIEWSMGSGQCPSCYGCMPGSHYLELKPRGHLLDCNLAHALLSLHQQVVFREGE